MGFRGQMYTLSVFTATMLSAAQAFGHFGPFALYLFLYIYSAVHRQPRSQLNSKRKRKSHKKGEKEGQNTETVNWSEEAQRNPFRGEASMVLVRSLLKEGDQDTATKEERARIVFQVMSGQRERSVSGCRRTTW